MRVKLSNAAECKRAVTRQGRVHAAVRLPIKDVAERCFSPKRVIDVGGSSVKILTTGETEHRSFRSGPGLTPKRMVSGVKKLAADWTYDVVSIGYPARFCVVG